jgi:hypothetical protein
LKGLLLLLLLLLLSTSLGTWLHFWFGDVFEVEVFGVSNSAGAGECF